MSSEHATVQHGSRDRPDVQTRPCRSTACGATCARVTSAGVRQPTSCSASSISARSSSSTCRDALLAADGEAPERRAADEHGAGAERERLDDVGAAADAAVDEHLDPTVDRLDDLGQRVDRRGDAVELPAAVVRDDDPGGAVLAREPRVLGGERSPSGRRAAPRATANRSTSAHVTDGEIGSNALRGVRSARGPSRARARWSDREARAEVALAAAEHRRVDGEHERREPGAPPRRDDLARRTLGPAARRAGTSAAPRSRAISSQVDGRAASRGT